MHGAAAAAIVTAAAGLPTPSVEGKVIRRTRLPRLATLQIHHPTRAQQTAGTPRSLSFTGTTGKKNPIKRRARLLPRRRSSFSYTEKPSPTRLRAKKPTPHTTQIFSSPQATSNATAARRASRRRPAGIYARKPRKTLLPLPPYLQEPKVAS